MNRDRKSIDVARISSLLIITLAWVGVTLLGVYQVGLERCALFTASALLALGLTLTLTLVGETRRWIRPLRQLANQVEALGQNPGGDVPFPIPRTHAVRDLAQALNRLSSVCRRLTASAAPTLPRPNESGISSTKASLTKSALFESPLDSSDGGMTVQMSGEFYTPDMVNRLEPRLFRWVDSSPTEQAFLGWDLKHLRQKSFLEIVHPDDVARVREQFRSACAKGEVHGLILRIRTAQGKPRAIEMNISARYGSDTTLNYLRCHITDVTAKVRAERELRLRTRELTQVNEQLRLINQELEELKERYLDLYQNAPAMYFSLDVQGRFIECNDTLVRTLGYPREAILGQPYVRFITEGRRALFAERFAEYLRHGAIDVASQWVKANGEIIDVWVSGTGVRDDQGRISHSRSVAQDVTARHRLEAELRETNADLARINEELSRKNKEMDEFTYVVSHDLQEPLRTLISFSDFLSRDFGDRLDANGLEYVHYIVDASRRMRALIQDLLSLSRAGKVTADFQSVNLEEQVGIIRADLAELLRSRNGQIRWSAPLPRIWGDRSRISQLLANLISNGLKYNNRSEPVVEIGALPEAVHPATCEPQEPSTDQPQPEWVTLFVRDNGIGIEPQFHQKIFKLFRRLHTREEYEGTGAGLAICKKIVEAHGGRIWLESEPGNGTTFFVNLERAPESTDEEFRITEE